MLVPPPEPPRPGLSPPEGDIASEPLPPVPGSPTVEPGCEETTTPEPELFPPSDFGGARTDPMSPGPPSPKPFLPEPESPGPEPTEGGGGTTLLPSTVPRPVPLPAPTEVPARAEPRPDPEFETEGGGAITLDAPRAGARPLPVAEPPVAPEPTELPIDGGGGTTLAASVPPGVPVLRELL